MWLSLITLKLQHTAINVAQRRLKTEYKRASMCLVAEMGGDFTMASLELDVKCRGSAMATVTDRQVGGDEKDIYDNACLNPDGYFTCSLINPVSQEIQFHKNGLNQRCTYYTLSSCLSQFTPVLHCLNVTE